jgi:fatty aldehyde-generating acyl-ACP reductase
MIMASIFGFISQFTDLGSVLARAPQLLGGSDVQNPVEVEKALSGLSPFVASRISGKTPSGVAVQGAFAFVPLLAEHFTDPVRPLPKSFYLSKIREAVNVLADNETSIVGLGSLTGSGLTGNGLLIRPVNAFLATGNTYAARASIKAVEQILARLDRRMYRGNFVVLGATGSIGAAVSHAIAEKISGSARLILTSRHIAPLNRLLESLNGVNVGQIEVTTDIQSSIACADVLIVETAAHNNIVGVDTPKSGCVIIDGTKPWNCDPRLESREDVLHIDGGLIAVPDINFGMDMDCPSGTIYACLAETMILWLRGVREDYCLGRVDHRRLSEMEDWAKSFGFDLAPFYSFGNLIPESRYDDFMQYN